VRPSIPNDELNPEVISLASITPIARTQQIDSDGAGSWTVTLGNPRTIESLSATDGFAVVQVYDDPTGTTRKLFFGAGQMKPYRVKKVFGSAEGSTIKCLIGE
jgi:hypothetical protein